MSVRLDLLRLVHNPALEPETVIDRVRAYEHFLAEVEKPVKATKPASMPKWQDVDKLA